jgi:hypothetical protein
MVEHCATILGGLPVMAEVWFTRGDGYYTDDGYNAGVDGLYWLTRAGKRGKALPQSIMDRLEKKDPYWQASVTEQVSEALAYESYQEKEDRRDEQVFRLV